jgi:hypothetical protein
VLQVGLGQPAVAGLVQVAAPGGLGDGALDAGAVGVALAPGVGSLLGAELLLGFVLGAGPEGEVAGQDRGADAAGSVGAGGAVGRAEGRLDDRQPVAAGGLPPVAAGGLPPVAAGVAVGAGDLLVVPVDAEPGEVKAVLVAGLSAGVRRQRADQLDTGVVVTADALQTHPDAAEFLVTGKHAHYLFVVKANQLTLLDRSARLAWRNVPVRGPHGRPRSRPHRDPHPQGPQRQAPRLSPRLPGHPGHSQDP